MKISDVMSRNPVCVESGHSLETAAGKMAQENVGSLPVTDQGKLVGVITDRDIAVRAVAKGMGSDALVQAAMTSDVVTCTQDTLIADAMEMMQSSQIRRIYVVDNESLVGVVSLGDLALAQQTNETGETLREISKP